MTRCLFCDASAVERMACSFHLYTAPTLDEIENAIAEAERRGARAMILYLLGKGDIDREKAEVARRAIEAGWVKMDENK